MKFIIANDCHLGSKYNDDSSLYATIPNLKADKHTILLGDIIDLACCKEEHVDALIESRLMLKLKHGDNYISGNHERDIYSTFRVIGNVFFAHGDLEANFEKWSKYRAKGFGAGKFKRHIVSLFDKMDFIKAKRPLPKVFLDNAAEIAKRNNCDYYVCGHFHPETKRVINHNGVTIIIMPCGVNDLELDGYKE